MITSNDEPIWVSKVNPLSILIIAFPLNFSLWIICISNWNTDFLSEKYIPLDNGLILIPGMLLLTGLALLIYKRLMTVYSLYDDRLDIRYPFRPVETFYLSDLTSWQYTESTGRYSNKPAVNEISLYFNTREVTFRLLSISNLSLLKDFLQERKPEVKGPGGGKIFGRSVLINILYIGCMLGPIFGKFYLDDQIRQNKGMEKVYMANMVLSDNPDFISHGHKNAPTIYEMRLKTQQVKGFDFVIGSLKRDEKLDMASKLNKGDTVSVYILRYDYDVKIKNSKEPSFWDKHFDWHHVKVLGIYSPSLYY